MIFTSCLVIMDPIKEIQNSQKDSFNLKVDIFFL